MENETIVGDSISQIYRNTIENFSLQHFLISQRPSLLDPHTQPPPRHPPPLGLFQPPCVPLQPTRPLAQWDHRRSLLKMLTPRQHPKTWMALSPGRWAQNLHFSSENSCEILLISQSWQSLGELSSPPTLAGISPLGLGREGL